MLARLRAWLLKTPVKIVLGLIAAYFLFAWFGFEPLVKWAAPKYVADKSSHHLVIGAAKFDPLALSVDIKGLKLSEPDGKPLLAFDELFVDFETSGLLRRALAFKDIRLTGPDANLVLLPDGRLNWTALLEAFKSKEEEKDKDLPRLLIDRIVLAKGRVRFTDRKVVVGYQAELNPIDFQLTDLSTLPDDKGAYALSTRTEAGARVRWKGQLSLNPILATGELVVDDVQLVRVWPYVKARLNMDTPAGVAAMGLSYRVAYDNKQLALALNNLGFSLEGLKLRGVGAAEPAVALDSLQVTGGRFDLQQRRLDIAQVALQGGHVHVQRRADGSIDLTDWLRPSGEPPVAMPNTSGQEAGAEEPALVPAAKGTVDDLSHIRPGGEVRLGGLAYAYKSTQLNPDSLPRLDQVAQAMRDKPELRVHIGGHTDSVGSDAYNLRMSQARAESVRDYLLKKGIAAERITTRGYGESRPVADNASEAGRAANRRVVLRFYLPGQDRDDSASQDGSAPGVWTVNLGNFSLDGLGVGYRDAGFASPLSADVGNVKLGFKAQAQAGAGSPQVRVEDFGVDLADIRLKSEASPQPLLVLAGVNLEGGRLGLAAREVGIARLALVNGRVEAERDAQGRIALAEAFKPAPEAKPTSATTAKGGNGDEMPWKYHLDKLVLSGFQVTARDRSVSPAAGLTLQQIQANLEGLSQDMKASLPVKLSLRVKEGGAFQADGKLVLAKPAADLRLRLSHLNLGPAQPYISQAANLTLASGSASASGRLKYDGKPAFDGGFQVVNLLLNESEGGGRFLAWKSLSSDSVSYRPEALNIEELKLDGLGAKLVIDKDKTVNLKKILKTQPQPKEAAARSASQEAQPAAKAAGPATRMTIDRIRVENGEMDFADYSLALPFATRIHDFKGSFNGISTQPGNAAQLELDGQVDEYGLARAVGQLDLFDPTAFMDIKVVFRNVEMTRLTPYTATFVGRKIDSGKLSLNLEYKLKDRQLLGENQIIMDQLTLGERVASPTAKDLPLDLAIAILQDNDGRIDLGLPVSGSLDDPQFSYGRIIWKAIGNIIKKIVTAPFRALASLFGGHGEKLEKIAFEAGSPGLTPPEREKFKQIATALNKRPKLALTVHPAWSADIERPVMKDARLRRAIVEKMGVKLAPDEDAGPLSTANPKVQAALEALYAARFGEEAWKTLQGKWFQANPEKKQESGAGKLFSRLKGLFVKEKPLSEADMAALKGTDLYDLLFQHLLAKEVVSDADLRALAERRGHVILAGLAAAGAPVDRVHLAAPEPAEGEAGEIPVRLELGVAALPAPAAASAQP